MPHQCTNCDRTFSDGSKEMLSGCPDCGGNKFQFRPDGADVDTAVEPPDPPEPAASSTVAQTVGKTAATVKDIVGNSSDDSSPPSPSEPSVEQDEAIDSAESAGAVPDREDTAQASARSDIVAPDELPTEPATDEEHHFDPVSAAEPADSATPSGTDGHAGEDTPSQSDVAAERPDLQELREELNDQFESIKVLAPGQYELNLMELYDREEYIVALEEDGRYSIQVPENFRE